MGALDAYVMKLQKRTPKPDYSGLNFTPATADASFYRGILGDGTPPRPQGLLSMIAGRQEVPGLLPAASPFMDMVTGRPDAPIPTNNYTGPAPIPRPYPVKPDSYVIRKGDTLSEIAKAHGTTVKALLAKNPQIKNANKIVAGKSLKL